MQGLVRRNLAIANAVFGVLEVVLGTSLAICGFIVLGLYRNLSGVGIWAGMPLIVPGLISLVLLATRHKTAAIFLLLTSIGAFCLCIAHTIVSWRDIGVWDDARDDFIKQQCYDRVDRCICAKDRLPDFFIQRCDLFTFGYELYWAMAMISLLGSVTSLIGAILAAVASCADNDPAEKYYKSKGMAYSENNFRGGSRNQGYAVQ